jgi:hypothetical protein
VLNYFLHLQGQAALQNYSPTDTASRPAALNFLATRLQQRQISLTKGVLYEKFNERYLKLHADEVSAVAVH